MAITRLNSLAIPAGTVEPADISYPLTNFSSTGIDDNADATAITIDSSENVGIGVTDPDATLEVYMPDVATGPYFHGGGSRGLRIADSTITNAGDRTEFYKPTSTGMFSFKNGLKELLTIKASGRVGIDRTNPVCALHVANNAYLKVLVEDYDGTDTPIAIGSGANAVTIANNASGNTADESITLNQSNQNIIFATAGSERLRVLATGGITFNGETTAAHALDDYEEGTWTPTNNANITALANAEGYYTKIGNLVTINFLADITPTATNTQIRLGGLPYSVADKLSGSNVEGTGVCFEDSKTYMFFALGTTSQLYIEFDRPLQGTSDTTNRTFRGSLTYMTS